MEKIPMTTAGFKALEEELRHRQQEERPRIIQAIAEARNPGDLTTLDDPAGIKQVRAVCIK